MLLAGRLVCFPIIERADELRQRVAPIRPGRMVLRQQQPRPVGREVAERDAADIIVSRQLGHIFGHRLLERELAVAHRLRQQRGLGPWSLVRDIFVTISFTRELQNSARQTCSPLARLF